MFRTSIFSRRVLATTQRQAPLSPRTTTTSTIVRPFSQHTQQRLPAKNTQDKDSLNPQPSEYSKSGTDDQAAAATEKTAFDPNQTRPEQEEASAEKESNSSASPLNVSPANKDVSKAKPGIEDKGGSASESGQGGSDRARTSGGGSPKKNSSGQKYSS